MSDLPPSIFTHAEPGPRFIVRDLANAIGKSGVEYSAAHARVKTFTKAHMIHIRERVGSRGDAKFSVSDMGAAVLLSAINDCGVQDHDVLRRTSDSLYWWSKKVPQSRQTRPHPIMAAVEETLQGATFWRLQLDYFRDLQTGRRELAVTFAREGEVDPTTPEPESDALQSLRARYPDLKAAPDPRASGNWWPVASILIPATPLLLSLRPILAPTGN